MQLEKYIGLKYKEKGRDFDGLDCWGLVRLVYKNEFKIDLPSFSSEYTQTDVSRIEELIAQYKEGWESIEQPEEGSIVLFRVLGSESHVGIVVNSEQFLHVRENQDSAIENFSSPFWKKRIVGYFKYSENKSVILNAVPNPLRTERYTMPILPGTTLDLLANGLNKEYGVPEELKSKVTIVLNGKVIDEKDWANTVLKEGDAVEYRAVPKGSAGRMIAFIALAIAAPYIAQAALGTTFGAYAATALGGVPTFLAVAQGATMIIGSALINAIAPIRPPVTQIGKDPGSAERQLMVNGGSNRQNPYGSIPVVLGKVRVTPLLGSTNYLTYENDRDSYVSMLLVWGYGPLTIDASTLKIGDIPLVNYTDYDIITLDRKTEPTTEIKNQFDAIYGKDITQVQVSTELTCDGNPSLPVAFDAVYDGEANKTTLGVAFRGRSPFVGFSSLAPPVGTTFTTTFVASNISNWTFYSERMRDISISSPNSTTRIVTATIDSYSLYFDTVLGYTINGNYSGTGSALPPGSWLQAATTEAVDSYTIALHFPQGLRKVKIKGDGAGDSFETSVNFRIEYSTDNAVTWNLQEVLTIGGDTPKKDGFTTTKTYEFPSKPAQMIVRIRRETGDNSEDNPDWRYYFTSVLQNVTFTRNDNPAIDPLNAKIAKTAFKIKATDQLNGRVDGVSAVVQTWCKIWNGSTWVDGASSNPAALFRYVLEHPANPRRITDVSSQINLSQLQYFYNYCATNGFEYNSVLGESRSVLDVLRDICAAGRASPAIIDGKWTIIIDEVKPNIIQHFTPHNSWGFEASKALPKKPDGLKVSYFDQDQDYQECEIIVYDVNKDASNSSLFESITLPGVTKKSLVIDHARWHFAQIKLRPEVYTLNADIEYLVCNRGDRVKVMHDVPMWGLGSGRVKNRISSTVLELDEDVPMKESIQYTIRFRSKDGSSVVRNIATVPTDGYYRTITLLSSVTSTEVDSGDLFLFGQLNQESQDLMVLSIEPSNQKSARITLVDYGVTDAYNIFTDYKNLTSSVVFESQLSLPPSLQIDNFGNKTPTITGFVSDESVMERVSNGVFRYNINVAYVNASQLPMTTDVVEVQYDLLSATNTLNAKSIYVPYEKSAASITDVKEGETYKVRMRYIGRTGKLGDWTNYSSHQVVGKTGEPSTVSNFSYKLDKISGDLLLTWAENPELDIAGYEVRRDDINWGSNDVNRVFYGNSNSTFAKPLQFGTTSNFYIRAYDYGGNYSTTSANIGYNLSQVTNVNSISHIFADTALTNATVTLTWNEVVSEFAIRHYEISYAAETKIVQANTITLPADWVGDRSFTIVTVDVLGNKSSGYTHVITKLLPGVPTNFRAQVIDNTVMLYWTLPVKTSLPIDHVILKKGATWATATLLGEKKGEFTTITESQGGDYVYWIAAVDTDNNVGEPISIATRVAEPPDFIFHGEFDSSFTSTKSSATLEAGRVLIPVNTTETWQSHFSSRGWTTIQSQLSAGYPIYVEPSNTTGYYEEVFDFGSILASSKVSLSYRGTVIDGNPSIFIKISLSENGTTYTDYEGVTDVYGLNFRYVKVRVTVTESTGTGLYSLEYLNVRLDAKLKNDAGTTSAVLSDTLGTIANFNKEFIDAQSITLSAAGTTPLTCVYDFKGELPDKSATYSVSGNVCTVTVSAHGMITGQKVKLQISSGTGLTDEYYITGYTTDTFTVNMTTANTTGSCIVYPESFRIYLFNSSGTRQSGDVSWSVKGY